MCFYTCFRWNLKFNIFCFNGAAKIYQDVEMLNNANVPLGTSAPWTGQIIVTEEEPAGETGDAIIC